MKTKNKLLYLLIASSAAGLFTACESKEEIEVIQKPILQDTISVVDSTITRGLFVLNSGSKKMPNSVSLTYYNVADSSVSADAFSLVNNRGLGDGGQDIVKYGSKIYISVYKSSLIEVLDAATGVSQKSIPMLNEANQPSLPRSLAVHNGKLYVSLYDGHVAKIDTGSLAVEKIVAVGPNPEGIAVSNNKLYVANSGGMQSLKDSTVSVINLSSFTVEKTIKVAYNPSKVKADSYGDVYVLSLGDYKTIAPVFQRIDATTQTATVVKDVKGWNFTITGDYAYLYDFIYDSKSQGTNKSFMVYDVKNEKISQSSFIDTNAVACTPYSIDVDPTTKNIYIGSTDYSNLGKMYCFAPDGKLKFSFQVGVNPIKTLFITNK